jgi:hypothetical protein
MCRVSVVVCVGDNVLRGREVVGLDCLESINLGLVLRISSFLFPSLLFQVRLLSYHLGIQGGIP